MDGNRVYLLNFLAQGNSKSFFKIFVHFFLQIMLEDSPEGRLNPPVVIYLTKMVNLMVSNYAIASASTLF
jgi:hypothetical protein